MNPFENNLIHELVNPDVSEDTTENIFNNNIIELRVEVIKGKKNTYISGWNMEYDELKLKLKELKSKLGCNGSLKKDTETNQDIVHLQGDQITNIYQYLINFGIEKSNIIIKGR